VWPGRGANAYDGRHRGYAEAVGTTHDNALHFTV
jgi:hypothetical protein